MTKTAPGLYLVNATGEMVPLHTEDGGDEQLLQEYLEEWDLIDE
jgi:hypothetical protein